MKARRISIRWRCSRSWIGNNPRHLVHYLGFLISRNQLDRADIYLTELKKTEPRGLAALEEEAALLKARNLDSRLLTMLETRGLKMPEHIGAVADLLARYGFAAQAEQAYKDFVARDPKQPERVLALARFYATQGRITDAMAILTQAWRAATIEPEMVARTALAVYDSPSARDSHKQQVRGWVESVVKQQPDNIRLKEKLATMAVLENNLEESISRYKQTLTANPDDIGVLNNLAWVLAFRKPPELDEALRYIDHAIELRGRTTNLADTRTVILMRSGRLDEALMEGKTAQQRAPKDKSLAVHLAWIYQLRGQLQDARQAFQLAEALGYRINATDPLERPYVQKLRQDLASQGGESN